MPVKKTAGGYKYGNQGKVYKTKQAAERQGRAIKASQAANKRNTSKGKQTGRKKS